MKITTLSFRQLRSGPGYEHRAVEATAILEDGETPEEALDDLQQWVARQIGADQDSLRRIQFEIERLKDTERNLTGEVAAYRERWARARAFLERHGLSTDLSESMPF